MYELHILIILYYMSHKSLFMILNKNTHANIFKKIFCLKVQHRVNNIGVRNCA